MTTLSWPTTRAFEPARVSWGVRAPSSAWNAFYTGQSQSIVHLGHRLEVTMSLPPCRPAAAAEREAFLMSLAARGDWVRLGHFARRLPLGNVGARAGVTVASAAAAGASSVALAGLTSRANLLTHGSFELDGNSDNLSDGITLFVGSSGDVGRTYTKSRAPTDAAAHGAKVQFIRIDSAGNTNDTGFLFNAQPAVVPGAVYTLSAWLRTNVSGKLKLLARAFDAGNNSLEDYSSATIAAAGAIARTSVTFTAHASAATIQVQVRGITLPTEYLEVDAVQLELGSAATDYGGYAALGAGDAFAVADQLIQCSYAGATADDAGAVTVNTVVPLRKALVQGAAVTLDSPTGLFQLVGSDYGFDYRAPLVQAGVDLRFLEVFA